MTNNLGTFRMNFKRNIHRHWMSLLMLFTFFVPALFASDQFPMQSKSQPLVGTLTTDEFILRLRTNSNLIAQDNSGNDILIPKNTTLEMTTSFLQMMDQYSVNKNPSQDDIFLNDMIQQFKLLKYFENSETAQVSSSDQDTKERKSYKQKVKIVDSVDKKLKEKQDLIVDIDVDDLEKFEVIEQEGAPYTIESDFDGDQNWNPNAEETVKDPKTEASTTKYCKKCQANKNLELKDLAQDLSFQAKANKINSLFSSLNGSEDLKVKDQLNEAIKIALKKKRSRSTGYCYRYTKDALLAAGITKPRLEGRYAKQAGYELEKQGFVNLLDPIQIARTRFKSESMKDLLTNPYLAPKGAVLVYAPNPSDRIVRACAKTKTGTKKCVWDQDAGHIEIKTDVAGKSGVVSDYYNDKPRTGGSLQTADRKLIGIYYKL